MKVFFKALFLSLFLLSTSSCGLRSSISDYRRCRMLAGSEASLSSNVGDAMLQYDICYINFDNPKVLLNNGDYYIFSGKSIRAISDMDTVGISKRCPVMATDVCREYYSPNFKMFRSIHYPLLDNDNIDYLLKQIDKQGGCILYDFKINPRKFILSVMVNDVLCKVDDTDCLRGRSPYSRTVFAVISNKQFYKFIYSEEWFKHYIKDYLFWL